VQQRKRPHCLRLAQPPVAPVLEMPSAERNEEAGLAYYREHTEALLRRYMTISMEAGRVSSLLGRELFRGKVSSYSVEAFDDGVIFVHDVEQCLKLLAPGLRHLLRRIAIEGYTHEETAALAGIHLRTVTRRYPEGLDKLTRLLLDRGIMERMVTCGKLVQL